MPIEFSIKAKGMTNFIGTYPSDQPTHPFKDYSTVPPTIIQAQSQPNNGGIVARVSAPTRDLHGAEFVDHERYLDTDERFEQTILTQTGEEMTLIFQHRASQDS